MRAIIIDDAACQALVDALKLESMRDNGHFRQTNFDEPASVQDVHHAFHYVVVRWLQGQGWNTRPM
jgi:phage replication-related protein YjqB (UPF0714/DUF867 family)